MVPKVEVEVEVKGEVANTLPFEDVVGSPLSAAGLDLATWDRYEILELLGKGGMAVVYKARDRHLGRTLAIKFLLGADPNLTMRFLLEARAQGKIDHPNVCRVYEAGEVKGRAYIALQLVDGEPLDKAAARMSPDEKVTAMRDVALAIQEAHRGGIVHRDLKPSNVMVKRTEDGRWFPIVMDFGLAREATVEIGITAAGALLGTPAYMYAAASEIARSDASLYNAAARAWLQRAELDSRQPRSARESLSLEQALDIIDNRALRANPDDAQAYTTKSDVLLLRYRTGSKADKEALRLLLDRIAQAAARAVEIDPQDAHAWTSLGNAHVTRGHYESSQEAQADRWWNRALVDFGKALAIQPNDARVNNAAGTVHRWLGTSLAWAGRDPMPEYRAALSNYERSAQLDPQYLKACSNQVDLYMTIAEHEVAIGVDPRAAIDNAQRMGERCLGIDPNYYKLLDNLAQAQLALARYLVETSRDPTVALASARGYIDRAESAQNENMIVWYRRLEAAHTEARFRLNRGADPTSSIATGRAVLRKALKLADWSAEPHVEAAQLDLVEAAWAARTGRSKMPLLAKALANAKKAVARDGQLAVAKLVAAEVCLLIATARPSRAIVDDGIAYVDLALTRNPRLPRAETVRLALLRLRAP